MISPKLFLSLVSINYFLFVWFSSYKKLTSLKEKVLLTSALLLQFLDGILPAIRPFVPSFPLFFLLQIYLLIRKGYNWLTPAVISALEATLIIISWLLTCDLWTMLFLNHVFSAQIYSKFLIVMVVLQQILLFILIKVISYFDQKYRLIQMISLMRKKHFIWASIIFLLIVVLITAEQIFVTENYPVFYYLSFVMISSFTFFLIGSSYFISKYYREKEHTQALSNAFKKEEARISLSDEFQHDYKNILISLTNYLEHGESEKAIALLKEITDYSTEVLNPNVFQAILLIEMPTIQGLLNNFINNCLEKNISVDLKVFNNIIDINMETVDFVRSLSILLDNALEAAEKTDFPYILVSFSKDSNATTVTISNSFLPLDDKTYQSIFKKKFSTKDDHKGLGLHIFSKIIKQYKNVDYTITKDNSMFTATLKIFTSTI
ncbi:two-component system, LytTR family, sensor histidine kinase AgrC [Enterococcus sp. DIV0724b]|uniref:sensor histidine kinase n=1 Tax=Enterococcus sp. DIV0724b TaxID=2774694 RepID=UPI003D2FA463